MLVKLDDNIEYIKNQLIKSTGFPYYVKKSHIATVCNKSHIASIVSKRPQHNVNVKI